MKAKPPPKKPAAIQPSGFQYLEVSERQCLTIMNRRPGELHTVRDFLKALKQDVEDFQNRAAVIATITIMEERGKCERGWLGSGPTAKAAWKVKPPEYRDPATGEKVDAPPKV